ncbi:MAG: hypothetical protein ABI934_12870, partial [Actinomycetota bacterium]
LALWFWMFAIVGGLLPLLLVALPWTRNVAGMVIASCLVLPMMWLKRMLLVIGPATYDTITRTFGSYHFTWVPIAITLAAAAAVPLMLMLLFRVVPLLSIDEIEEMHQTQTIDELDKMHDAKNDQSARPPAEPRTPVGRDDRLVGARGGKARSVAAATGALLLVVLVGMFGVGTADNAQAAAPPKVASTLKITGSEAGGSMELAATLTGPHGQLMEDASVAFAFSTTEFGAPARLVSLGSATTDKAGIARLTLGSDTDHMYRPTTNGPQEFVATYNAAGAKPLIATTTINVTIARSAYHPAPAKPLAGVGDVLVVVLFGIVAAIWLTLITQIWRVRRVCRVAREPVVGSS